MDFFQHAYRIVRVRGALFVLAIVSVFLVVQASRMAHRVFIMRQERIALSQQLRKTIAENAPLRREIDVGHSRESVERAAKEQLNLRLPGEEVLVVVAFGAGVGEPAVVTLSWWKRLWNWFFLGK